MRLLILLVVIFGAFAVNSNEMEVVEKCHGTAAQCQRF